MKAAQVDLYRRAAAGRANSLSQADRAAALSATAGLCQAISPSK